MSYQTTTSVQIPPGQPLSVSGEGDVYCSVLGEMFTSGGTPIQHNYPRNPFPQICRITSWFDATRTTGPHHADDVVFNSTGHVPLGTPVYAMEAGTVTEAVSGQPSAPYPACKSTVPRPPGDHVKIQTPDGYTTLYFHMNPSVSTGTHVNAGDQIGTLDSSGCQSGPHLHVGRKDPNGASVNFTIPCVNPLPPRHKL
jgi:murein DD-endopeptidase MepM/ murein hydrolase activator NlpD